VLLTFILCYYHNFESLKLKILSDREWTDMHIFYKTVVKTQSEKTPKFKMSYGEQEGGIIFSSLLE
jgi:hypothetical protein